MKEKFKKMSTDIIVVRLRNGCLLYHSSFIPKWHFKHTHEVVGEVREALRALLCLNVSVQEVSGISVEAWLDLNMSQLKREVEGEKEVGCSYGWGHAWSGPVDRISFVDVETYQAYKKGHWTAPVSVWISEE